MAIVPRLYSDVAKLWMSEAMGRFVKKMPNKRCGRRLYKNSNVINDLLIELRLWTRGLCLYSSGWTSITTKCSRSRRTRKVSEFFLGRLSLIPLRISAKNKNLQIQRSGVSQKEHLLRVFFTLLHGRTLSFLLRCCEVSVKPFTADWRGCRPECVLPVRGPPGQRPTRRTNSKDAAGRWLPTKIPLKGTQLTKWPTQSS